MWKIVVILLLVPVTVYSQQVSENEAQAKAQAVEQQTQANTEVQEQQKKLTDAVKTAHAAQMRSEETLADLAREVEELRSRVTVSAATYQATQKPQAAKNIGSKTYYNFREGGIYEIHAGVDRVTDIELQPGEKLTNQPVSGDTVRWSVGTMQSVIRDQEQVHLVVKPLEEQLETNIVVTTNRRVYHLRVTSGNWYMPSVGWHYPDDDAAAQKVKLDKKKIDEPLSLPPDKLNFDYEIIHHREGWAPLRCFDDGLKTYLQMPRQLAAGEAPALFLIEEEAEPVLVNYRVKGDFYILDRIFDRAELRVGKGEPVIIYSSRKPRTFWERVF